MIFLAALFLAIAPQGSSADIKLVGKIPMPGVAGRIDHFAIDGKNHRLFVAALGNGTVEVLDCKSQKRIRSIRGFGEPQGVVWDPIQNLLAVADGEKGDVRLFDGATFKQVADIKLGDDADNMRFGYPDDVYVGYGSGGIAEIDMATRKLIRKIGLPGHPEAFEIGFSGEMYVNIPSASLLCLVDLESGKIVDKWAPSAGSNFPMLRTGRGIGVGCRNPAKFLVYDFIMKRPFANFEIDGDVDDLCFDFQGPKIYAICGSGQLDVLASKGADYRLKERIPTAPGARTGIFDGSSRELYIAAPARDGHVAEILIYKA
jgi:hypothetical protein